MEGGGKLGDIYSWYDVSWLPWTLLVVPELGVVFILFQE